MHINSEWAFIEIVNDKGNRLPPDAIGRIVVTAFHNLVMPFIRYRLDDVGSWYEKPCSCGRTLPRIKLWGRGAYFFRMPNGDIGHFEELVKPFVAMTNNKIRQFQVIRQSLKKFTIKIVLVQPLNIEDKILITESLLGYVGQEAKIKLEIVENIEAAGERKPRPFINLYNDLPFTEIIK